MSALAKVRAALPCAMAAALLWLALATVLGGCAAKEPAAGAPRPLSGVEEYKQVVAESHAAVAAALQSLDQVGAQTEHCPPKLLEAFSRDVQRLQVDSIRVRARVQAIHARGDAYFESWSESMSRIEDPRVRELAEQSQPQLRESYSKIKTASHEAGGAFRPFLQGLRDLRTQLETRSGAMPPEAAKDLVPATRAQGQEVVQKLTVISNELQSITRMLTPAKSAVNR